MDTQSDTHEHVLGSFYHLVVVVVRGSGGYEKGH